MRCDDAPILHRSQSTPAPTLLKRASSGTGVQIVPLMLSRVNSEKEVEALSARVQRLASISRCPELIAVARQHSKKAEQVQVAAEPVSLLRRRFFHPRRQLEDYPDAEQKRMKEEKKLVKKQEKEAARARRRLKFEEWLEWFLSNSGPPDRYNFVSAYDCYDDEPY